MASRISDEIRLAIAKDLAEGMMRGPVALKHGVSMSTVERIDHARLAGRTIVGDRRGGAGKLSDEQRARIVECYRQGNLTARVIGERFGVSDTTVLKIAKEEGLSRGAVSTDRDSPKTLDDGAWIYDKQGVARWVPGATSTYDEGARA